MNKKRQLKRKNPICIGAGLVALDVVMNGNPKIPSKFFAGGSCGNVLTILSFLNWESIPIARLKENDALKRLLTDLISWKVNISLISQSPDGSTPIIIQRIKTDKNGNPIHNFQFRNPDTGEWLPSYKPVLRNKVHTITMNSPAPSVFYFDRVNRSSIDFAKYFKEKGAIIFFEPSSMNESKQFEECLSVADIVKFSNERIKNYATLYPVQRAPLEIETRGKDGINYRFNHQLKSTKWTSISSYNISYIVDAAGSGDWFSAGVISKIAGSGSKGFENCQEESINNALKYGQALGALNCFFVGARGLMYSMDKKQIERLVKKIQNSKTPLTFINKKEDVTPIKKFNIGSLY